ncbi:MAG: fatty acid desaturase [Candidatus Obscuribacterales bacterium]|nr:fatty acid desaturase [Steroidobacteraceae bacterium]
MSTSITADRPPINWVTATVIVSTFLLAVTVTPWYGFTYGFSTAAWVLFFLFMGANGMAITAGYHRLWSHRTYTAHWSIRMLLMIFGTMALQASIQQWASNHRTHHQHVDDNDRDPYSAKRGFWFSHVGWMLREYPSSQTDFSNVRDIKDDPIAAFQHRFYLPLVLLTNVGLTLFAGWLVGDVWGVFWLAGMARLVLSHHVTWFINSLAHAWGSRPYTDKNTARDNGILALITYGEGYHNFHHLYASDYRNGVRWWHYDPTKWLIFGLSLVGLTSNLRRMPDVTIQQARLAMQFKQLEEKLACPKSAAGLDLDKLRTQFAHETEAFRQTLAEWATVRDAWYTDARQRLVRRWEKAHFRTHSREVVYRLRMQHRRLQLLNAQFA